MRVEGGVEKSGNLFFYKLKKNKRNKKNTSFGNK